MNTFQILFALEDNDEEKLESGIEILCDLGIQINSVYLAQSKNEITELLISNPEINVIVISEQLKGFFTINDFRMFNTENRIIIPVISRYKRGNAEAVGNYVKNNFYNFLFEGDMLISEVGEILKHVRTAETAAAYAGLVGEDIGSRVKTAEFMSNTTESDSVGIQFVVPACDRTKQTIFGDKSVLIGFCGADSRFCCTLTAISAANYIALGGVNVAFIEPDLSKGSLLDQLIPCLSGKKMISCSNVDYYSEWDLKEDINSADVIIFDLSGMLYEESVYLSKMNKIFICSDIELTNTHHSVKLQNNSSFKYSILYNDNSSAQNSRFDDDTFDVFRECPQELIRMLKLTLQDCGIGITNIRDIESGSRINQLNRLNRAEYSARNINNSLLERRRKQIDEDIKKETVSYTYNRRPQPVKAVPDPRNFAPREMLNRSAEAAVLPSDEPKLRNVQQNLASADNKIPYKYKVQIEEEHNSKPEMMVKEQYPVKDNSESYNAIYSKIDEDRNNSYNDKDDESYEAAYIDENRNRFKKRQAANQVLCGKETIFITGLKHGCGCSHTGLSFAKHIVSAYEENICICHRKGAYDLEDEDITEYTKDTDYDSVFGTNRFIIYDCGILGELNADQLVELKRCNIKIMVCNGDEKYLGNLSNFIRKLGNTSNEWIFAFNLVTSREKEIMIHRIMDGYKICFIPLHDCESMPKKISKLWDSVLKRNLL